MDIFVLSGPMHLLYRFGLCFSSICGRSFNSGFISDVSAVCTTQKTDVVVCEHKKDKELLFIIILIIIAGY